MHETIYSVVSGDGPPVVLIHGMAASLCGWQPLKDSLVAAGYRTYAVDLPGHGESHKPDHPAHYTADAVYSLLEEWLDSLGLQQPALLVGHSLGGYMSLRYALDRPRNVRALALIDPFYSKRQLSPVLRALNRRPSLGMRAAQAAPEWLIHTVLGLDPTNRYRFSAETRRQMAVDYKRASPYIYHISHTLDDLTDRLEWVRQPALVVWGDRDLTLSPKTFPRLVELLPQARGQVVHGSGHQPHITQPFDTNPLILRFFAES